MLKLAQEVSTWSKDPSTRTGAVITRGIKPVSWGFNGLPRGVEDDPSILNDREKKYRTIIHCEENAIIFAGRDLHGCTLYTWPLMSCAKCSSIVIQSGIRRCVATKPPPALQERWGEDLKLASNQFTQAGVELVLYEDDIK